MSIVYPGAQRNNHPLGSTLDRDNGKYNLVSPIHEHVKLPVTDPQKSTGLFVCELIENEGAGVKLLAFDSEPTIGQIVEIGTLWEHLDAIGYPNTHDYTASVPGIIRLSQLKTKVETKSYGEWLEEGNWDEVLA
ncbi:MAG: hypothetical protein M1822_006769 [Bathelium mastoideum]|nr:MAG: hypothetical protein M1822_006769 [Bathelium mastoideum]